jgi:hypothetical protein
VVGKPEVIARIGFARITSGLRVTREQLEAIRKLDNLSEIQSLRLMPHSVF